MGNNPIRYTDMLGDTLRGVNELSAQRLQGSIFSTFAKEIPGGIAFASLLKLSTDGKTFSAINKSQFRLATKNLSPEAKALARGYMMAINSTKTTLFEVVKQKESLSEYGKDITGLKKGAQLNQNAGGGETFGGKWSPENGMHVGSGTYIAMVMDASKEVSYTREDGSYFQRPSSFGEIAAHEIIGHDVMSDDMRNISHDAVKATNIYLKAVGESYYRTGESHLSNKGEVPYPQQIPNILRW
jgi:hypothetical protein